MSLVFGTMSVSSTAAPEKNCEFQGTLNQLLANADRYDQKSVCVTGLLHIEFEGDQLSLGESKVWLKFFEGPNYTKESVDRDAKRMNEWKRQFQDKCVVLRGRLNVKNKGHFGMWPAGIEMISRIETTERKTCSPNSSLKNAPFGRGTAQKRAAP